MREDDNWVALPRLRFWGRLMALMGGSGTAFWFLTSPLMLQLALWVVRAVTEESFWTTLSSLIFAALLLGILLTAFLAQPTIRIRSDGSAWRRRGREHGPESIDRAVQHSHSERKGLWLALCRGGRIRFSVPVPMRAEPQLDERQLAAVIALVERAPIELPPPKQDPWDPKGRFAHLDRQGFLDAADAILLLRDPPATGLAPNADQRKPPRKGGVDRYPWSQV